MKGKGGGAGVFVAVLADMETGKNIYPRREQEKCHQDTRNRTSVFYACMLIHFHTLMMSLSSHLPSPLIKVNSILFDIFNFL